MLLKKAFLPVVWLSSFVVWFTVFRSFSEIPISLRLAPPGSSTACLHTVLFWNFQGCITVHLSRFCFHCCVVFSDNSDRISYVLIIVNTFFNFFPLFSTFFKVDFFAFYLASQKSGSAMLRTLPHFSSADKTEKEGFEPSRRLPDLHP